MTPSYPRPLHGTGPACQHHVLAYAWFARGGLALCGRNTPLHDAANAQQYDVVRLLVANGADVTAVAGLQALDAGALADVAQAAIALAVLAAAGDVTGALAGEGVADEAGATVDVVAALDANAAAVVAEASGAARVGGAGGDAGVVCADQAVGTRLADGAGADVGGPDLRRITAGAAERHQEAQQQAHQRRGLVKTGTRGGDDKREITVHVVNYRPCRRPPLE